LTKLPYIYLPELDAKFLVDTGSTRTLVKPELAYKQFPEYIRQDLFQIQTAHQISQHSESAYIPLPKTFKSQSWHKFYLFDFNKKYDGLIGVDLLRQLKATINLENKTLTLPTHTIPLHAMDNPPTHYSLTIEPRTEQIVKIPVNKNISTGVIEYTRFTNDLEMPTAYVRVRDNQAITTIINKSDKQATLTLTEPIEIIEVDQNTHELNHVAHNAMPINVKTIQRENLKNLRLQHLNEEEATLLKNLCEEFKDIFHDEKIPLTFTNRIKHDIKTTDNTPIYTKTYRYPQVHRQEVEKQINKMLSEDIIQPSTSPWSSPVWVVPKKLDASGKRK
jgi:predicted aspartyl protease